MNKLNVVIPIKEPNGAKSRLGEALTPDQRCTLAQMLFEGVLGFFQDLPGDHGVLVVTDSKRVGTLAQSYGAEVLLEDKAEGETAAVEKAACWSIEHGYDSQVVIPGDMAELDRDEMLALFCLPRFEPSVILCPATDDDGTNAIITTPPNAIPFRFGERSFSGYKQSAIDHEVPCLVFRVSSLVLDLDTPEDLQAFVKNYPHHPASQLLHSWNTPVQS